MTTLTSSFTWKLGLRPIGRLWPAWVRTAAQQRGWEVLSEALFHGTPAPPPPTCLCVFRGCVHTGPAIAALARLRSVGWAHPPRGPSPVIRSHSPAFCALSEPVLCSWAGKSRSSEREVWDTCFSLWGPGNPLVCKHVLKPVELLEFRGIQFAKRGMQCQSYSVSCW